MNLGDPELELIDPTPNVHSLFLHFDKTFFWAKLSSRAIVRWSKRMYSCAGVCSYEGRGGLCDIALSEPLLKLRPRKDLIETLLHEMIHAYLFITCRDQDRDGHGPNFKSHMYRINQSAGLNISIYHSFHDEVELYQTHWWRCNGPCQKQRPHFGIVRRSMNKAPGPNDYWWNDHRRKCGGTFIKIKEPEKKVKKGPAKPNADITKYVNVNKGINNKPLNDKKPKGVLKDSNSIPGKSITKSNSSNTVVVTQNGTGLSSKINSPIKKPPIIFSGKGQTLNGGRIRSNSVDAAETVRNVWANKQLSNTIINNETNNKKHLEPTNTSSVNKINNRNKHKADSVHADSPPIKMKKIDDYFKNAATILKDLYGQDFNVSQSNNNKLIAVPVKVNEVINEKNLVDCPVCSAKVSNNEINRHLDECLNKEVIEKLSKDNIEVTPPIYEETTDKKDFGKNIIVKIPPDHQYKTSSKTTDRVVVKTEKDIHAPKPNISKDLTNVNPLSNMRIKTETVTTELQYSNDFNKNKSHNKKIDSKTQVRKTDSFIIPKEEKKDKVFLDDMMLKITNPLVKIEPGTSKSISSESIEDQKCACCGNKVEKPIEEHLEECLAFFDNNTTIPEEGASTNIANDTIIIDDDEDIFDETLTLNATGTKCPCPCCLEMIEQAEMNEHLDNCLS